MRAGSMSTDGSWRGCPTRCSLLAGARRSTPGRPLFERANRRLGCRSASAFGRRSSARDGAESVLDIVGPRDFVGEMGAFDDAPRSATIVALEPMELLHLTADRFDAFLMANPEACSSAAQSATVRRLASSRSMGGVADSPVSRRWRLKAIWSARSALIATVGERAHAITDTRRDERSARNTDT